MRDKEVRFLRGIERFRLTEPIFICEIDQQEYE
jgi:hypothetical protein